MKFRDWKYWISTLPWSMRWFAILILIRPVSDVFYTLKEISPLLSPLYIVGVLTPVLILMSFLSKKFPKKGKSNVDFYFTIWGAIVFINLIIILIFEFSLTVFGDCLKYFTPVLLFFYLRHFIRSKRDLTGLLQTFLYAAIFPFTMLLYEYLFNPIAGEMVSEGRGGGLRYRGGYADVMNYAVYIIGAFLISGYFFLSKKHAKQIRRSDVYKIILVGIICVLGLGSIIHTSSWAVFTALFGLFMLFYLRSAKSLLMGLFVIITLSFLSQIVYESQIRPLIAKEIRVYEGESKIEASFNGRMGRWKRYFAIWQKMPYISHVVGVSTSRFKEVTTMVGGGMHNDYIRILFLSGIIGLMVYLIFIFSIFKRGNRLEPPEKFLVTGAVFSILMYSVSALPTLYTSLMYLFLSIFAYACLPMRILRKG